MCLKISFFMTERNVKKATCKWIIAFYWPTWNVTNLNSDFWALFKKICICVNTERNISSLCFHRTTTPTRWYDARDICTTRGGQLMQIRTQQEKTDIDAVLGWVGLNLINTNNMLVCFTSWYDARDICINNADQDTTGANWCRCWLRVIGSECNIC